jgi:hypothetical protein
MYMNCFRLLGGCPVAQPVGTMSPLCDRSAALVLRAGPKVGV